MSKKLNELLARLEKQVVRLEGMEIPKGGSKQSGKKAGKTEEKAKQVVAYEEEVEGKAKELVTLSNSLFAGLGDLMKEIFDFIKKFITMASKSKKPKTSEFPKLLEPMRAVLKLIDDESFKKKRSPEGNHYLAINELAKCCQFVAWREAPFKLIKECFDQSTFYTNKVLREFRKKDEKHVNWVKMIKSVFLDGLMAYIKENHTTGLRWNAKTGGVAKWPTGNDEAPEEDDDDMAPPPDMDGLELTEGPSEPSGGSGKKSAALFADISKGGFKLKKVTRDMKNKYKPLSERSGKVSGNIPKKGKKKTTAKKKFVGKPRIELEGGKKFQVEWQEGNNNIQINPTSKTQSVYAYKCSNSTIFINSKVNSICMDSCTKTNLIFDDCIAGIEVINSKGSQVQAKGECKMMQIDSVSGLQVFISEKSLDCEIVVSKSSAINVCPIIKGDYEEYPASEQILITYNKKTKKLDQVVKIEE